MGKFLLACLFEGNKYASGESFYYRLSWVYSVLLLLDIEKFTIAQP